MCYAHKAYTLLYMETMLFISAPPVSIARVCWISSPAVAIAEAEFVNPVPRSAELVAKLFNLLLSDLQDPTDHNFIMAISHFWLIPTFHF